MRYFPPRAQRRVDDEVLRSFPPPLADSYAMLQLSMDRDRGVHAALQLRDAFECVIKFSACMALAHLFATAPQPERLHAALGILFKHGGLSLGDWLRLLRDALQQLHQQGSDVTGSRALIGAYFRSSGSRLAPLQTLQGMEAAVNWRNRTFGHGAFRSDDPDAYYASETLSLLDSLHQQYNALKPVLRDWVFVEAAGESFRPIAPGVHGDVDHAHRLAPDAHQIFMRGLDGQMLAFGPLLSVQHCANCEQSHVFFYEKNRFDRAKETHVSFFLEYVRALEVERRNWSEITRYFSMLPADFRWVRSSFDASQTAAAIENLFNRFDTEYLRPDHALAMLWDELDERANGYFHVIGGGGIGKSFMLRGFEREALERGLPVLSYFVRPGALGDYRTFVTRLAGQARERFSHHTQEVQTRVGNRTDLSRQLGEFIGEVMRANALAELVLIIDGLDELPEPPEREASIMDFLPMAADLPRGCSVIMASRPTLKPRLASRLREIQAAGGGEFRSIALDGSTDGHQTLLRGYATPRLVAAGITPNLIDTVISRCGGSFLYLAHYCAGLASGAYRGVDQLPVPGDFGSYLDRLRDQVGTELFESAYLPVLFAVAAAREPVTRDRLRGWGVYTNTLDFVLTDLGLLIGSEQVSDEEVYGLNHVDVGQYLQRSSAFSDGLRQMHAKIAGALAGRLVDDGLDPNSDEAVDTYLLRFGLSHAMEAGEPRLVAQLAGNGSYVAACLRAARGFGVGSPIALDLLRIATEILADADPREDDAALLKCRCDVLEEYATRLGDWSCDDSIRLQMEAIHAVRRAPADEPDWMLRLAEALLSLSRYLAMANRDAEAWAPFEEGIALLGRLLSLDSGHAYQIDLARALMDVMLLGGNDGAQENHLRHCLTLLDSGSESASVLSDCRAGLAQNLARRGNHAEALLQYQAAIDGYRQEQSRDLIELVWLLLDAPFGTGVDDAHLSEDGLNFAIDCYREATILARQCFEENCDVVTARILSEALTTLQAVDPGVDLLEAPDLSLLREVVRRAESRQDTAQDPVGLGEALSALADALYEKARDEYDGEFNGEAMLCRLAEIRECREQSAALFSEAGEPERRADELAALADMLAVHDIPGIRQDALNWLRESTALYRELRQRHRRTDLDFKAAKSLMLLSRQYSRAGQHEAAIAVARDAVELGEGLLARGGNHDPRNDPVEPLAALASRLWAWREGLPQEDPRRDLILTEYFEILGTEVSRYRSVLFSPYSDKTQALERYIGSNAGRVLVLELYRNIDAAVEAAREFAATLLAVEPEFDISLERAHALYELSKLLEKRGDKGEAARIQAEAEYHEQLGADAPD